MLTIQITRDETMATHVYDLGDESPDFRLESQVGLITFHDFIDSKWCLLMTFGRVNDPVRWICFV
jgi:hypothetical protein